MNRLKMPVFLHDVFGEKQSILDLLLVMTFAVFGALVVLFQFNTSEHMVSLWKQILGFVLILDVLAGCVANFSRGTNDFYAARSKNRVIFLAIHFHIIAIAWLLDGPLWVSLLVWAYTIVSAVGVNGLKGSPHQQMVAGFLTLVGILALVSLLPLIPVWMLTVSLLFMLKVVFSFAVDHYASERKCA